MFRRIFISLFLTLLSTQQVTAQPFQQGSTPVEVRKVETQSLGTVLNLTGTVRPRYEATIGSEVSGKVEELLVEEGDTVKKDDVLAQIDPDRYQALFKAAEARFEKTSQDLTRGHSLFKEGFLSKEALDRRQVDHDSAKAVWEIALIELKDDTVTAPFNGIITRRFVDPGEWLDRGDPVFEISDLSVVHVMIPVPERFVQEVSPGQKALLTINPIGHQGFEGTVRAIIPKADQGKNYPVKIEVKNPDVTLKNGMFALVLLTLQTPEEVIMVPKDAVVHQGEIDMIFVVRDQKAQKITVHPGREQGALVEVNGEIKVGDLVVVTGNESLHDGDDVKVVNLPADEE
jgi:membrane fusion protein (multidrug efflux system)